MYLTREEEAMLRGDRGEAVAEAMKLIVRVGEALGAERLVEISHAHASGISYDNIGEPGLEFIEGLAARGGRANVYSTYNPAGIVVGVEPPEELRPEPGFEEKQWRIIRALESMGVRRSITCIPYTMRKPGLGEHLAWGESSAVAAANTLYGARTNREGGPLALAAALTGRTYLWGLHLAEERRPTLIVKAGLSRLGVVEAGLLGYYIGLVSQGGVPYVHTPVPLGERDVISMCAAAAASGSTAMCIVRGVSPEDRGAPGGLERVEVDDRELAELRDRVETASLEEAELFFTGCPHHGAAVVERVEELLNAYGVGRLRRPLWVAVPGYMAKRLRPVAKRLRRRNVYILPGTCIVVARLRGRVKAVATDSLKAAFYLPRRHGVRVALATLEEFVAAEAGRSG